jgi:hypothetical protein
MALLMILVSVFVVVGLMVILGERYGKPMAAEEQSKYAKVTRILVFIILVGALIKGLM